MIIEAALLLITYSGYRFKKSRSDSTDEAELADQTRKEKQIPTETSREVEVELSVDDSLDTKPSDTQQSQGLSIAKDKNEISRNLKISAITLGLATIRQFVFAPIAPIYLGFFAYQNYVFFDRTISKFKENKKIGYDANVLTIQTVGIGFNQYFMVSLAVFVYFLSEKVISLTESQSEKLVANSFKGLSETVWCLKDGAEIQLQLSQIEVGDLIIVNAGEVIPVDGLVWEGAGLVDQHALTGESQLAEKGENAPVFATTILMSGRIIVRTKKAGQDTTAAKIDDILNHSVDYKSEVQLKGEKWADLGVVPFFAVAALAGATSGVSSALAVLTAHFGSRIRILAPLGTLGYLKAASNHGVLIKNGSTLETLMDVDTVLFDKTGTLTNSDLSVEQIFVAQGSEDTIIAYAAAAQGNMAHPVAQALTQKANEMQVALPPIDYSKYKIGFGISATIDGAAINVGSERFMASEDIAIPESFSQRIEVGNEKGHSFVMVSKDNEVIGCIELKSVVRDEVHGIVDVLHKQGIKEVAIVSGDREETTRFLADQLGMDNYFYNVLPQSKAEIVEELQRAGKKVCFIGDGINDAIAMRKADVSVSLAGASSIATDVADVILMDGTLHQFSRLFTISSELERNLNQSFQILIVPATIIIPGALLFATGFGTALIIKNIVFLGGLGKAVWPLYQNSKDGALINQTVDPSILPQSAPPVITSSPQ